MSKISIAGNASGTGTLTIAAPNTNTDYTLNLPANSGDLITSGQADSISTGMIQGGAVTAAKLATGAAASNLGNYVTTVNSATGAVTVQPTLVSGTNIKSINGSSILGSGDLTVGGGKILQVVNASTTAQDSWTGTSVHTSNVTATMSPTLSSSKVLVMVSMNLYKGGGNSSERLRIYLYKNGSNAQQLDVDWGYGVGVIGERWTCLHMDSPATTSAITYNIRLASTIGDNYVINVNGGISAIVLMEVGA